LGKKLVVENFKFVVKLSKFMHGMLIAQKKLMKGGEVK